MARKHFVSKLTEPDLSQSLNTFLSVINQHATLAHFRALVPAGPTRQLALFAALERAVIVGTASSAPPAHDDEADQLLCDILEVIDTDPQLKNRGAYYGPNRYLVNLQALGAWNGDEPVQKPSALELFATEFSKLSAAPQSGLTTCGANTSPTSQEFTSNGEVIDTPNPVQAVSVEAPSSPQTIGSVVVLSIDSDASDNRESTDSRGILRHLAPTPGEEITEPQLAHAPPLPVSPSPCLPPPPHRPLRRGQPPKLDDLAKGRILGLMSYGLSFRQAAAQLGVHHQTILNAMKRDEQFAQQVSEARFDAISQPLVTVIHASRTNWRAAAWLAKFLNDRRISIYETTPEEHQLNRAVD